MNIAIISPFQFEAARGIERYTWSLAETLVAQQHRVTLFGWQASHPIGWGTPSAPIRVRQVPHTRYFREHIAPLFYLAWLRQDRFDWVIAFFGSYGEAPTLRFRPRRTRACLVFHFPKAQAAFQYAMFDRTHTARRADRLIAVSQPVARDVEATFGRPCAVIENGVNPDQFRPDADRRAAMRQTLGIAAEAPVLMTLAALEERKGVQWIIAALPALLAEFPALQYWVFGEGAYRTTLEDEIRRRDLGQVVHLAGNTLEAAACLNAADIGCLLSIGEAFPLTMLEYMATALPILTSRQPPFDSLVKPDFGLTVDEQDSGAVTAHIRDLLRDPDRRHRLGQAGRAQVLAKYTWAQVAAEYVRLLTIA